MIIKYRNFLLFSILLSNISFAKKIEIEGRVFNSANKDEVISYCVVSVNPLNLNTYTDLEGKFKFFVEKEGKYNLVFNFVGFKSKEIEITVPDNIFYEVGLDEDNNMLNSVEIIEKVKRNTKEASILKQRNAIEMVQAVSSSEMALKGVSNVEEGVAKISGVSSVRGQGIYVRGLGDRYNNAMLNDMPIVSDNPDNKTIDFSLLPSGMVKSMNVYKTFSTFLYGDFAGVTVDIETKNEYPDEMFFEVNLGTGYNTITTNKDFFTIDKGGLDIIGLGASNRNLPSEINPKDPSKYLELPINNGRSIFKDNFYQMSKFSAYPPMSVNFFGGNKYKLSNDKDFGFMVYGSFDNSYSYNTGVRKLYSMTHNLLDYQEEKWNNNKSSLFVLNTGLIKENEYEFNLNIININNSDNSIEFLKGYKESFSFNEAIMRNSYLQTNIIISQLLGKYHINSTDFIDAGFSFSRTRRQEPDRISLQAKYSYGINSDDIDFYSDLEYQTNSGGQTNRFWSDMIDYEIAQKLLYQFNMGEENTFKIGINAKQKFRESDINQYGLYSSRDPQYNFFNNKVNLFNPETSLEGGVGSWQLFTDPRYRGYKAEINTVAGYIDYRRKFGDLLIELGIRLENTIQTFHYRTVRMNSPFTEFTYDPFNVLPEINFKYSLDETNNLRMSLSNTITRPSMLELRPSFYKNADNIEVVGNPELLNSNNYNIDIKWENFSKGGVFGIVFFGKYIEKPIERIINPSGGNQVITYVNTRNALALGLEIDIDQSIGRLFEKENLKDFYVGLNASYLHTKIVLGQDGNFKIMTNDTRQLQGASPFILNLNMAYKHVIYENFESTYSLVFNIFQDRLYSASSNGMGDIYEKGYPTLDFVWKNKLNKYISLDFKARNLLNPEILRYQKDFGEGSIFSKQDNVSYKLGQMFSISLKYNI